VERDDDARHPKRREGAHGRRRRSAASREQFRNVLVALIATWLIVLILCLANVISGEVTGIAAMGFMAVGLVGIAWTIRLGARAGDWQQTCGNLLARLTQMTEQHPVRYRKPRTLLIVSGLGGLILLLAAARAIDRAKQRQIAAAVTAATSQPDAPPSVTKLPQPPAPGTTAPDFERPADVAAEWVGNLHPPATRGVPLPPRVRLFEENQREYLSDLEEFGVLSGPWPVSNRGRLGSGGAIRVNGAASPHGIGMHPPTSGFAACMYRLGGQAAVFKAQVAIDDSGGLGGNSAIWEVRGDGRRLWLSGTETGARRVHPCRVDVRGVDALELRVYTPGSHWGVHAVWLEPRVLQRPDTADRD
jgi:hypothetical protein